MTTLSSRQVSLSAHVKRRRSSAALSSFGSSSGSGGSGPGNRPAGGGGAGSNSSGSGGDIMIGNGSNSGSGGSTNNSSGIATREQAHPQHSRSRSRSHLPLDPDPVGDDVDDTMHLPPLASSQAHHQSSDDEGGYDSHAASYGNYDAPSHYCRNGPPPNYSDHGCYAAESYIGTPNRRVVGSSNSNNAGAGGVSPRRESYSNPYTDLEGQQRSMSYGDNNSRRRPNATTAAPVEPASMRRASQASTVHTGQVRMMGGAVEGGGGGGSSWEEETYNSHSYGPDSSFCPSAASSTVGGGGVGGEVASTASTASSSGGSDGGSTAYTTTSNKKTDRPEYEDALRCTIIDISTIIATYLAGGLSFIIGIFITLASPFIKAVKLIVGDVWGILGDAGFVQELGSLWNMYRELRRRSGGGGRSSSPAEGMHHPPHDGGNYHPQDYRYNQYHNRGYYDDESTEGTLSTAEYTANSSQFVGGWRPSVASGSVGSGTAGTNGSAPSYGSAANGSAPSYGSAASSSWRSGTQPSGGTNSRSGGTSSASRSYSSLPLVYEEEDQYHQDCHSRCSSQGSGGSVKSAPSTKKRNTKKKMDPEPLSPIPSSMRNHYPSTPTYTGNYQPVVASPHNSSRQHHAPSPPQLQTSLPMQYYDAPPVSPQKRRQQHHHQQQEQYGGGMRPHRSRSNIV